MTYASEIYNRAIEKFGTVEQIRMAQEECAELIAVLNQSLRGRVGLLELTEEIADVQIMLDQLKIIFGEQNCSIMYQKKMARLQERLNQNEMGV